MSNVDEGAWGMNDPTHSWSRRAPILTRVLEWVNAGIHPVEGDSWMVLGARVFEAKNSNGEPMMILDERRGDPKERKWSSDMQVWVGKIFDARRTSLEQCAPKVCNVELPPSDWRAGAEPDPTEIADDLDTMYSMEVIGKLEEIVRRAALLSPHKINVGQIHKAEMRAYFQ